MRLNRLELTRYGVFTDHVIDFGPAPGVGGDGGGDGGGAPDLHVVYGPNEAGKSTTFAAFLDLLYGIGQRSPYGFLHPYPTMRIGAEIAFADGTRGFVRLKKNRDALLDGHERPIPETAILAELGGIDRAAYETMFSLNDATLSEGGESILASGGELGQLLFAASAGLSGLSDRLGELRAEAETFHKPRARSTTLAMLKARLDELRAERERLDTAAKDYKQWVEERDGAAAALDGERARMGEIRARLAVLRRQSTALPRLHALRGLEADMAALADIPDAPAQWADTLPRLREEATARATRAETSAAEIGALTEEIESIVVDTRVLDLETRIEALDEPRARHLGAEKDLPERRLSLREVEFAISGILARLGRTADTDPGGLIPSPAVTGTLRGLIKTRSGIEQARTLADRELAEARRRADEAEAALNALARGAGELGTAVIDRLNQALTRARDDDHAARLRLADRARVEAEATLADHLAALRPWGGAAAELRDLAVPDPTEVDGWRTALEAAERRREGRTEAVERLEGDHHRGTAEIAATRRGDGVVTDGKAAEIRARRDAAWAAHRDALTAGTADAFAASMRDDDDASANRLANAAELARLRQSEIALARVAADLETARRAKDEAEAAAVTIRDTMVAAITAISPTLPADWSPARLGAWLEGRRRALENLRALETADRDAVAARRDGERVLAELRAAAEAAGLCETPDTAAAALMATIQGVLGRESDLRKAREVLAERRRDLHIREGVATTAGERDAVWRAEWASACAEARFDDSGEPPTLAVVEETLGLVDGLVPLIEKRVGLVDRIAKMSEDRTRFAEMVRATAREMGMDEGAPPLGLAAALGRALADARAAKAARRNAEGRLREARERAATLAAEREIHARRVAEMLTHFGTDDLLTVERRLRDLERRRDLARQADTARRDILDAMSSSSIDEARRALDPLDRDTVTGEMEELESRLAPLETRVGELHAAWSKAADRLDAVGGDDAVARIEARRRTTLLEIEDGAWRHLRIRLGIAATERALDIYRDRHRGSMMARASDAFRVISRGAYDRLTTQPGEAGDRGREILVAVSADGGSRQVKELSKGTRFQLYLALRVAGYHEFAQARPAVPFVADDIMESFDDFRAEEAFRLLAGMATVGQVVYLTHHRHLCDIARTACPGARVHELRPGP